MRIPAQWISHAYGIYLIVKAKVIMYEIILNHIVEFRFNVGKKAKFWNSSWLQEMAPSHSTTTFFKKISSSRERTKQLTKNCKTTTGTDLYVTILQDRNRHTTRGIHLSVYMDTEKSISSQALQNPLNGVGPLMAPTLL